MTGAETEGWVDAPRRFVGMSRNRGLRVASADDMGSGGASARRFSVAVMSGGHRTVVRPIGELDLSTIAEMEASLQDALAKGTPELVLDLHSLDFCDAAGLQVFVRARRAAFAAGASLWLEHPTRIVRRVLDVSGLAWLVDSNAAPRNAIS